MIVPVGLRLLPCDGQWLTLNNSSPFEVRYTQHLFPTENLLLGQVADFANPRLNGADL